jgi:hypothetical protein
MKAYLSIRCHSTCCFDGTGNTGSGAGAPPEHEKSNWITAKGKSDKNIFFMTDVY